MIFEMKNLQMRLVGLPMLVGFDEFRAMFAKPSHAQHETGFRIEGARFPTENHIPVITGIGRNGDKTGCRDSHPDGNGDDSHQYGTSLRHHRDISEGAFRQTQEWVCRAKAYSVPDKVMWN